MSGYYEMNGKTDCWEQYNTSINVASYNRTMDTSYWQPPNASTCQSNGIGIKCSSYGRKDVPRTTQESFLQGRGQVLNDKCPDGDVVYLPSEVFKLGERNNQDAKCQVTALDPYFDRQPRSCFNISETDTTAYTMGIPGAWQGTNVQMTDFNGSAHLQDREMGRDMYAHGTVGTSASSRGSYGNYNA